MDYFALVKSPPLELRKRWASLYECFYAPQVDLPALPHTTRFPSYPIFRFKLGPAIVGKELNKSGDCLFRSLSWTWGPLPGGPGGPWTPQE